MKSPSLAATTARFEDLLVESIHRRCLSFANERLAYCLAINYGDVPESTSIPTVGLGLLHPGQRIELPRPPLTPDEEDLWNPAEFPTFADPALQPEEPDVQALDEILAEAAAAGRRVVPRNICRSVAARLDVSNWQGLKCADNFLVYAVDDDLADLDANLRFALQRRVSPAPR